MRAIFTGISFFFQGFSLLATPGIKRYAVVPVIINLLLFIGAFFGLRYFMSEFNTWVMHYLPAWLQWLQWIFWLLFFVSFFIFFIYTFVTIANIIAAPFNSLLAEKVDHHLTGYMSPAFSLRQNFKDLPRIVGRQISVLGYYLPRATLLLILFLIPVVQLVAPLLWFLFNAWYLTLTYVDYPCDNHRIGLTDMRVWLKERRFTALGFGMAALVCMMIPLINLFAIPAAVAGGTLFWIREQAERPSHLS